jgi:hypothetical protein
MGKIDVKKRSFVLWLLLALASFAVPGRAEPSAQPGGIKVHYKPWTVLFGPKTITDPEDPESESETITFYGAGTIDGMFVETEGTTRSAELVVSKNLWVGIGKDDFEAANVGYRRYARINKTLYYLPLNSAEEPDFSPGTEGADEVQVVAMNGYIAEAPKVMEGLDHIRELQSPKVIQGPRPGQTLDLVVEAEGTAIFSDIVPAFVDPVVGQVYMTKPGIAVNSLFFLAQKISNIASKSILRMSGPDFLTTNGFFVFRPDGTFLVYRERFDWEGPKGWNQSFDLKIPKGSFSTPDGRLFGDEYIYQTKVGCLDRDFNNFCSVAPDSDLVQADLESYAQVTQTARPIFRLKDKNHPLYKKLYELYKKSCGDWSREGPVYAYAKPGIPDEMTKCPLDYDAFVAATPILLFKDAFGRWIRLLHRAFLPPSFCEPVIYLYPTQATELTVHVAPMGGVTESAPPYANGWQVLAHPDGKLNLPKMKSSVRSLFWEGQGPIFPMRPEGSVVARKDIEAYLDRTLAELGLSASEAEDFKKAWLAKLQRKSFCFITFYGGDFIDRIAPLDVEPRPDTVLRILMDYKPLDQKVSATALPAFSRIERKGFTVVEWGGIER